MRPREFASGTSGIEATCGTSSASTATIDAMGSADAWRSPSTYAEVGSEMYEPQA